MTASHIREWASKEADPESETTPLGQAKQRIVKNWPQGKSTCLALPMVAVMLRKLV